MSHFRRSDKSNISSQMKLQISFMKRFLIIGMLFIMLAAVWWCLAHRYNAVLMQKETGHPIQASTPMSFAAMKRATFAVTGETHSMVVDELVGLAKRHQAIAPNDMQKLLSFISAPKPEGLSAAEWEERVNVILNALRGQESDVPGLTNYLLTTAEHHPSRILRLYAMQHLTLWHEREKSAGKRSEIVALLERLAEKDGEETAGSAVMFLNDLEGQAGATGERQTNQEVIGRAALKLVADPQVKQDVRISALHTCTERRMAEVLPAARQIAGDMTAVLPLRKAAVYCIGQLGAAEDRVFLERLHTKTSDLRAATEPAIKLLTHSR